ncbi:MAG: SDR family NAD(P)-dependent oxidoreductase [Propioniciclava sp.]|uniref:SDR family NAD(P)-dependent oxidoreductase n=1 Tax=Propioniciclava sp. TaxID=2038686 RepID=UPI0039E6A46D
MGPEKSRILVTGASAGLGWLTATTLADAGHQVVLHARHAGRLEDAGIIDRMHGVVFGDLASADATAHVAEEADGFGPFDAVIHNAGVIDGPDLVAVNVVAPFLLTALMTPPARMIVLSSSMHLSGSSRQPAAGVSGRRRLSYSDTKLYVTAFTMAIARRWPQVMTHAVCPGWVPTRMGGPSATDDLTEGHRTQEWLATAAPGDITPRTGGYWHHLTVRNPHPATLERRVQDELIDALEKRTGLVLPG